MSTACLLPTDSTISQQLIREYRQWQLTDDLRTYFITLFPSVKSSWLQSAFDRWLLNFHTTGQQSGGRYFDPAYPLYPHPLLLDDPITRILIREIASQLDSSQHSSFHDAVSQRIAQFLQRIVAHKPIIMQQLPHIAIHVTPPLHCGGEPNSSSSAASNPPSVSAASVTIGEFTTKSSTRLFALVRDFGLEVTALMLLRYEALGAGSYQWGEDSALHEAYYNLFHVRYEGFASPLNSRLLGRPDAHFCSLFPDTDRPFGSLGNFMLTNLLDHPGGWCLNPPFIDSLLDRVVRKVLEALNTSPGGESLYFFITMPRWENCTAWLMLHNSGHLRRQMDFEKNSFILHNAYEEVLNPYCGLTHFIVGFLPQEGLAKLPLLTDIMHNSYAKWHAVNCMQYDDDEEEDGGDRDYTPLS